MKEYIVIDAHCDTASEIYDRGETILKNNRHISLEHTAEFSSYVQFYAAWISKDAKNPMLRAVEILDHLKEEICKNKERMMQIRTSQELETAIHARKHGVIFAIEDGRALCGSLAALRMFHEMGVRAMTLAWNDDNELTDGIASERGAGLTAFGKSVVREMNRLHMMVDVSHITKRGFWDVVETSCAPVMASHSNCSAICGHRRNLDDDQIKAIIKMQGMICVSVYPEFVSDSGRAGISDLMRHIDHILSLGGENCLGLGSDFDGVDRLLDGMRHAGDCTKLFDEMQKLGFCDARIDKITHKNMINFMKRIEK